MVTMRRFPMAEEYDGFIGGGSRGIVAVSVESDSESEGAGI